jgi:hypothetical protein
MNGETATPLLERGLYQAGMTKTLLKAFAPLTGLTMTRAIIPKTADGLA